jgi:hypothetical protein
MHCNREYRAGESCGIKLAATTKEEPTKCPYCEKADKKLRQRELQADRLVRWQREGRNPASVVKCLDSIKKLDAEISRLYSEIARLRTAPASPFQRQHQQQSPVVSGDKTRVKLARKVSTTKQHFGLPVTFGALESPVTFMSCPDTGSSVNAISQDVANHLGLVMEVNDDELDMKIQLANGKWISSCGYIIAICSLNSPAPDTYLTIIYVFQTLTWPGLFIGKQFLEESQARARGLLRELPYTSSTPLVRSIGSPMQLLSCSLNGLPIGVVPDTGSQVDLMRQEYAERHFHLDPAPAHTEVEYADGSVEEVFWTVRAELAVGCEPPVYGKRSNSKVL